MPILVTGGGGFIGSVVVRKLVEARRTVRCLLRSTSDTSRIDGLAIECVHGDVRDQAAVREAFSGCESAVHLAGIVSWDRGGHPEIEDVVVGGTKHVLDVAASSGCAKVVYVSSILAIGRSAAPETFDEAGGAETSVRTLRLARVKCDAERLCRQASEAGLPVVIVNPGEVYGPNDFALVTAGNLIDFGTASPVLVCDGGTGVVHVDDAADGIIAALDRDAPASATSSAATT